MKNLLKEFTWFVAGTFYLWIYYFLLILMNPFHPKEEYATIMFIGSFIGLPLLLFGVIPILNAWVVLTFAKTKKLFRIIVYVIGSLLLFHGILNVHQVISNQHVKKTLFPQGVNVMAKKHFEEVREKTKGEITFVRHTYQDPYHNKMNAANMSGTRYPALVITYKYEDCGFELCTFDYKVEYDQKTKKPVKRENTIERHKKAYVEAFQGDYQENGLSYSVILIDHANDGLKLNFRQFEPYFNYDVIITKAEPTFVQGDIVSISNDMGKTTVFEGDKMAFQKNDDGSIHIIIDGTLFKKLTK